MEILPRLTIFIPECLHIHVIIPVEHFLVSLNVSNNIASTVKPNITTYFNIHVSCRALEDDDEAEN